MPKQLKYVAQQAQDLYLQNYKTDNDFFDLNDFILYTGNTIAAMYMQFYQQEYAMLRQERKDEVITFDVGWLSEQEVSVEKEGDRLIAKLDSAVMTFPYDKSSIGLQSIFVIDPYSADELERTNVSMLWQLKYLPKTNRIFFYPEVNGSACLTITKIAFVNKGTCNIKKIKVLYVPSLDNGNASVPDGLIADAITKTVAVMRQIATNNIVDKTQDNNPNKILQTEINTNSLK